MYDTFRSALVLSVNLNRYAPKVASHIKLPLVRSVLPDKDLQRRREQGKEREKAGGARRRGEGHLT